ncbi:hypothetical protein RN001_014110 [Aquatica leii]|uniref:SMP-LTD domain-containing protein n=1 Tax=Aquatica leii TaxID=1421715 RepID=A0AAN7NX27_9COLE|nr:hypothetical protein RN001_014110 [Aquatica leii]
MNKSKDGSKITLGMIKGKGINTSVPSISIRFNANAEEIEEFYQSEDESEDKFHNEKTKSVGVSDPDTSPLRYLPRLGKRSTSIDTSLTSQDSSPPTDRWKFFTEIKGKITKGVEEIKHRNQEIEQPTKKTKTTKDKDSSLSESDEMSESSISKTCGIVSTTEGVEMSSDDETPSIEDDKNVPKFKSPAQNGTKHHRYRIIRKRKPYREGKIPIEKLVDLYEITTGTKPNISFTNNETSKETVEVESGIEAFEDTNLQQTSENCSTPNVKSDTVVKEEEMIADLVKSIVNVQLDDDNVLSVSSISGEVVRTHELDEKIPRTYLAPEGFVDLRRPASDSLFEKFFCFRYIIVLIGILVLQLYTSIPSYITSFLIGILCTLLFNYFFEHLDLSRSTIFAHTITDSIEKPVIEIPAVKEYRPIIKIEGWMNEYPEDYNPRTYHIARTQSVYIKLQGNLLRISHTKEKIPKRALWNEAEHKNVTFTDHRVYNLLGANVNLAPIGLNKRRRWSKKYPICITFNSEVNVCDNFEFDNGSLSKGKKDVEVDPSFKKPRESIKKRIDTETQIFSKLNEEELLNEDDDFNGVENEDDEDSLKEEDDELSEDSLCDWGAFLSQDSPNGTQIYLFGRTDREKEEWYRNFTNSTRKGSDVKDENSDSVVQFSDNVNTTLPYEQDYIKYMNQFQKLSKQISNFHECNHKTSCLLWINAILSRVLFDFTHDDTFTDKVQERIQRKLSSIKLPQFVEQLPPLIHAVRDPKVDDKGLWVDMDVHYEGNVSLKLQTKLNLMRLKHNASIGTTDINEDSIPEKWQYSDVDDTAESSSDEDVYVPTVTGKASEGNAKGNPSNSKKFIKIVDKITESKIFQAATDNRYIKKAMEGVSNTDLCLKVELKDLTGTLVLNIPPPPSDRMWIGFRPLPKLILSAQPIVGDRNISFFKHLSSWIEKKLILEFQKVLVIPNMEDVVIPIMISKLPT